MTDVCVCVACVFFCDLQLKSSRSQSLLSQLLDDESSCLQSMTSSFRCSQVVRIFDLYQHMPHADLDTLLVRANTPPPPFCALRLLELTVKSRKSFVQVRDLIIAVASLYEIQMDETLALYVADEMGFREEGFPALTQNACVGVVGEDSFVLMQGEQRIAHVQIKPRKSVTVRKPGESWKYDGDHYISPIREKDFSYHRRELNCSVPSEGWYSYHSHQQLADKHLSKSQKQTYSLDGEERRDSGFLRRWQHRQSEDAITEPCTEDENEDDADDADAGSNGPASDEEIFDFDDA